MATKATPPPWGWMVADVSAHLTPPPPMFRLAVRRYGKSPIVGVEQLRGLSLGIPSPAGVVVGDE